MINRGTKTQRSKFRRGFADFAIIRLYGIEIFLRSASDRVCGGGGMRRVDENPDGTLKVEVDAPKGVRVKR